MNNRSENSNTASFDEHSRAESWDSNDRLEAESSAANIYAQGGLSRLQTYAANQVSGKKVTASWRAALAVRDAGLPAMLRSVRTNIVQSIRAFRTPDLQEAATELGQHFIYANCANAMTKGEVLEAIAIGPLLLGVAKPIHILTPAATVRRIVNVTTLAVVEAASDARGIS